METIQKQVSANKRNKMRGQDSLNVKWDDGRGETGDDGGENWDDDSQLRNWDDDGGENASCH